ncbi:DUF3707 domain-containing protein [Caenorhabditis elegans]|uniref:DUF3707 domain-containing protein n=1 Tax=Caenorhabditis elegans TaxID=6239 RepID=Q9BKT2_CAEEL|nr:DUF3707 domain-containing protein [Caenorhabditis elegans]CCD73039.2 DUF3707 domain-containing protein [Caenorhabditis elegans]
MYCEGDYKLLVFDPVVGQSAHTFGALSADGFCDASTQTWSIDEGSGKFVTINQMNGVCVKNSKCRCASMDLYNENAGYYIGQDSFYQSYVKDNVFVPANVTLSADGCQFKRFCPGNSEPIIYWSRPDDPDYLSQMEYITDKSTCDPKTGIWALTDGTTIRYAELFAPMCVFRDRCATCDFLALQPSNIFEIVSTENPLYKIFTMTTIRSPTIQMEDCRMSMSCEYVGYSLIMLDPITAKNSGYTVRNIHLNH